MVLSNVGPLSKFKQFQIILTLVLPSWFIQIFTHLKLSLASATHNFKWLLQVAENYLYLFYLSLKVCKSRCLDTSHFQYQWFSRLIKQIKNNNSRDQQAIKHFHGLEYFFVKFKHFQRFSSPCTNTIADVESTLRQPSLFPGKVV